MSAANRLRGILDFLGIPSQLFHSPLDFAESVRNGSLSGLQYSVISSLQTVHDVVFHGQVELEAAAILENAHSVFAYLPEDTARSSQLLQDYTGNRNLAFAPIEGSKVPVQVSSSWPEFTGPMHGIETFATARPADRVLKMDRPDTMRRILSIEKDAVFFSVQRNRLQLFVSCSSKIPDIKKPLKHQFYDVKDHFLCTLPVLMYLKWAFSGTCWQANEAGACLIIDDPILKTQYGFCNFRELDRLMQEHSFTTNVAFIPWNWRRTSVEMAALARNSESRLSISVHGCDHTGAEFGTTALETLNSKTAIAKRRMERHKARTGIAHDLVMVFPQGVFSRESLTILQQHQFLAAVNTEPSPINLEQERLTIADIWSVAIMGYGSFPFFVRRYPAQGLENFAFDLLLGKPCLIVEHHQFFKGNGRKVINFVSALNSLNCRLKWRGLGDVLKRSYHWRKGADGVFGIRMFANELLLGNDSGESRTYQIEKADQGSVGVKSVLANGTPVEWQRNNGSVVFKCELPPGAEISVQVRYRPASEPVHPGYDIPSIVKTAARRYLSEFRDNCLSRHEGMLNRAQKIKIFLAGR